ncbi:MAG: hypothetical protein KAH32_04865 [Chlamydiia bacterium]|nr:hypothetical protein [Chlamydiia bacterium]
MSSFNVTLINLALKRTSARTGLTPKEIKDTAKLMYYYKSCQSSKITEDMDLYKLGFTRITNGSNTGGLFIKPTVLWRNYHKFGHISDEIFERGLVLMKPFFDREYEQLPHLQNISKDECKKVKIQ